MGSTDDIDIASVGLVRAAPCLYHVNRRGRRKGTWKGCRRPAKGAQRTPDAVKLGATCLDRLGDRI